MNSNLPRRENPHLVIDSPIGTLNLYFYGASACHVVIWRQEEFAWQGHLFKRLQIDMTNRKGYWRPFLTIALRKSINGRWAKVTSSLRQKGSLSNMLGDFVGHYCDSIEALECRIRVLEAQQLFLLESVDQNSDNYWRSDQGALDYVERNLMETKVEIIELEEILSKRRAEAPSGSLIHLVSQQRAPH